MSGLRYHAPTNCFVLDLHQLKNAADDIRHAMKLARELGGFPLEPHKRDAAMTPACHLEHTLLTLADDLGIDLGGGRRIGQLDLRDAP